MAEYTKEQLTFYSLYQIMTSLMYEILKLNGKETEDICYTSKKNGEYGYYITDRHIAWLIVQYIRKHKINSFVDLGCGAGLLLNALRAVVGYDKLLVGIENEQKLIDIARNIFPATIVIKKDITKDYLDIKRYQLIYFWEPTKDKKQSKMFVENLESNVYYGQKIIYQQHGCIGNYLDKSKRFKLTHREFNLRYYKVI